MENYIVLLRGINVGGKNKMPMAQLKACLEEEGFENVSTYIQSGNVLLQSKLSSDAIAKKIEKTLSEKFKLDSDIIKTLPLTVDQLSSIIKNKPKGFGEQPEKYHSDAIFLIDIDTNDALTVFKPMAGVDMIWPGNGVIYSQRLSSQRTKSRLSRIIGTPVYKFMTIRNWKTTETLLKLALDRAE